MKRINIFILLLAAVLILTGCGVQEPVATQPPAIAVTEAPTPVTTQPPTEAPTEAPQPVPVAITMENWEEYFELRDTEQVHISESCSVINRIFGYGVFLKEEYVDRLAEGSDVSFELEYNLVWRRVMGDLTGDSYMLQSAQTDPDRKTQTAQLTDFRGNPAVAEESDFYNSVAVEFAFDAEFGA